MINCTKRQNEVYKGEEQLRCINREADLFLKIVDDQSCSGCPVMALKVVKGQSCIEKARKARMEMYASQSEPMEQSQVIEPRDGEYPPCQFRHMNGEDALCTITDLQVDPEVCGRCDKETREQEAKLGDKIVHYVGAVRRWVAKGRPSRSKEEIEKLFKENCEKCDRYDPATHSCKNCGCAVTLSVTPLANKLAMATEVCPLGRF